MGGEQSRTRKITVENEDPTSVIKVSDDVVRRIRNSQGSQKPSKPAPPPEYSERPTYAHPPPPPPTVPIVHPPSYLYEPSLTTVQLRQSNLAELKKNDKYWEQRLRNMQANHKKIEEVMNEEYKKAVEEYGDNKKPILPDQFLTPCNECKDAVMECYKCYPNEPMKCSKEVAQFQKCVDKERSCLIANRG